ncbi:hypothetical protein F4861DRAFT_357533 [Xylaria intraflava]|nr:hypothetical protein F4861DRAFT_357533 [Xylaria intraflava]
MLTTFFGSTKPKKRTKSEPPRLRSAFTKENPVVPAKPEHPPSRRSSDINSTLAEAGTDNELDKLFDTTANSPGKMASNGDAYNDDATGWTPQDDRVICVMKSKEMS